jgi:fumarate hydratase class II
MWGPQTDLAIANFPIAHRPLDVRVVHALALIKQHAATVNAALGVLDELEADGISAAAARVVAGEFDDQFPIDVYQTGSGTSTNMNVNEVIAHLAGGKVHPNDDVNASQSSNDTVPTAIRIAVALELRDALVPALDVLVTALDAAATRFDGVVKAGRTHLMDATPVMLGDEFAAWAAMLAAARSRVLEGVHGLAELPLGGTAVGTGVNCPPEFAPRVILALAAETRLELRPAKGTAGRMAHMGGQGALASASSALRDVAIALTKVANDIRLLASGPATGVAELRLPSLQPGSSIMPGKVNPVLCEAANQVAARAFGNDAVVGYAASQGILELNTYLPVMADALLESATLLANVMSLFAERLVAGTEADVERCRRNAERTPSLATTLNPVLGYDAAAAAVKQSLAEDRSVRDVVLETTDADPEVVDTALDPVKMARPYDL